MIKLKHIIITYYINAGLSPVSCLFPFSEIKLKAIFTDFLFQIFAKSFTKNIVLSDDPVPPEDRDSLISLFSDLDFKFETFRSNVLQSHTYI